jgi:phosphohistidine phosphatase SixA
MSDTHRPMHPEYERGRQDAFAEAAALADFYAVENFRLGTDTILTDRFLRGERTAAALRDSTTKQAEGAAFSGAAHCAQHIAAAIREKAQRA